MDKFVEQSVKVIDKWLDFQQYQTETPSIAVGVVYGDKMVFSKAYGFADIVKKTPATNETCYRIASISKSFTATSIMQLSEKGLLCVEDKVMKYLPWFIGQGLENVSIKDLLTHSSGINRDGNTTQWIDDIFPSIDDIKNQVLKGIKVFEPGVRFKYSNLGYSILGEVISSISGMTYDEYVINNIFKPVGMTNTFSDTSDEIESRIATAYGRYMPNRDREIFKNVKTNAMSSATGVASNVVDLCKYMSAQFEGSKLLLSDKNKLDMHRIQWYRDGKFKSYGYGFDITGEKGQKLVGHGGGFQGFSSRIMIDPETKIGVVILTNSMFGRAEMYANGIFQTINYFKNNSKKYKNNISQNMAKYEGLFTNRWGDIQIVDIDGNLFGFSPATMRPTDQINRLEHIKDDHFKIVDADEYDYIGEDAVFKFSQNGDLKSAQFGASPHILTSVMELSAKIV